MPEIASASRRPLASPLAHWPWLLLAGYWLVILTGTHLPSIPAPPSGFHWDKLVHFTAYAGLAFLIAGCFSRGGKRLSVLANCLIWLVVIAYGVFDEFSQPRFGRSCDLLDWYADVAGATVGLIAQRAWREWRRTRATSDGGALSSPSVLERG